MRFLSPGMSGDRHDFVRLWGYDLNGIVTYELKKCSIPFERQKKVTVRYKGHIVGTHRLDFVIDGKIVLELKAVSALTDVFKQQTLSYLKATDLKLGILINFGTPRVEYIRIVN